MLEGLRNSFWFSALLVVGLFAAFFYALFAVVPYLAIFLAANFLFVYVAVVYLLKFWEKGEQKLSNKFPSASVIIPCYNSAKTIDRCVESVFALEYPRKLQVIVVDDASTDATKQKLLQLKKRFPSLEIMRHPRNQGKARSLNLALTKANGEIVACIDSDTYPARAELDGLIVTPGPMSIYSAAALEKIGGFDEDNITEDMEIALHLQSAGYKIRLTTDAVVRTDVPDSWAKLFKQRLRWLRGKIFNGRKYRHML